MDIDCPGILIYRKGELADKIIPANEVLGGKKMNIDTVEFVLGFKRILDVEFEEDPREKLRVFKPEIAHKKAVRKQKDDISDEDEKDDREYSNNQFF